MTRRRRKARVIRASRPKRVPKKVPKKMPKKAPKKRRPSSSSRRAVATRPEGLAAGISSSVHVAQYDGVCEACGRAIRRGAAIRWNGYTRKPRHADCSLAAGESQVATPEQKPPKPQPDGEFVIAWRYLLHEDIPPPGAVVRHPERGEIVIVEVVSEEFIQEDLDWAVRLRCRKVTRADRERSQVDEVMVGDV